MKKLIFLLLFLFCYGFSAHTQNIEGAEDDGLAQNLEVFQLGEKFYVKSEITYLSWGDLKICNDENTLDVKEIVTVFVIMDNYGYKLDGIVYKNIGKASFKNKVYKFKRKS